ncbi:ABC transporter permease [Burkholderia singularis]|uniref:ABC transporter permease n=1 Tax=Burkholderia singularis TaxID=1503053 RepID=UPI000B78B9FF|nr:ABC transporter permease [Burkholderia singularis]
MTSIAKYAGLAPVVACIAAGVIVPLGVLAVVSLSVPLDLGGVAWGKFSTLAYWSLVFDRDFDGTIVLQADFLRVLVRSIALAAAATLICLVLALPSALYIVSRPARQKNLLLLAVTIPFWICIVVQMYGWLIVLADNGIANRLLNRIGVLHGPLGMIYTDAATLLGLVYAFLPFMVLPIYAALDDMDWRLIEAAYDLGATQSRAVREIVIPICRGGIAAGVGLVFAPALGTYVISNLLGGSRSMMIGNLVDFQFAAGRNWPLGAAMAFALLGIALISMLARRIRVNALGKDVAHEFA